MPFVSLTIVFALIVILSFSVHYFISKRGIRYLNYLLGLFLFARFTQIAVFLLIDNELIIYVPILLKLFCPLYYVAPGFIYLYTVGIVNNQKKLRKIDYLHFLPGLVSFIDDLPWYFSHSINWDAITLELIKTKNIAIVANTGLFPSEVYLYFRPILLTIYLILSFWVLFKSQLNKNKNGGTTKRIWLLGGLSTIASFHILNIVTVYFRAKGSFFDEDQNIYLWVFGIGLLIFLSILLLLVHNPKILYGYILVSIGEKYKRVELIDKKELTPSARKNSDTEIEMVSCIQNYMIHEKPFLNSAYRVMDLASSFQIPIHQCSGLINKHIGKNFNDWVNNYRIEHFIKTYPLKSQKITIDAIAFESGFMSMTTFYRAFKKETGKMPLQYFSD
ncbi:helix-turn-helix domain-containing protein [Daejeonella sp.]|uniref:helix-turn-helix domain-containing protein n=1 Tax=Daejeonella sp. TaxID=2805397 RepID=UPI0025BA73B1|nr:helix-turn-helix domain-containing protein [Daejeonella sp.]